MGVQAAGAGCPGTPGSGFVGLEQVLREVLHAALEDVVLDLTVDVDRGPLPVGQGALPLSAASMNDWTTSRVMIMITCWGASVGSVPGSGRTLSRLG